MKFYLSNGSEVEVDKDLYPTLNEYSWHQQPQNWKGFKKGTNLSCYAVKNGAVNGKNKQVSMHRFVYEHINGPISDGYEIDHADRNTRNNQIANLSMVTRKQNMNNAKSNLKLTLNGVTKGLLEWCEELGLRPKTIKNRLERGFTEIEALSRKVRKYSQTYTVGNITDTKKGWSIRSGVPYDTIVYRLHYGKMSMQDAINPSSLVNHKKRRPVRDDQGNIFESHRAAAKFHNMSEDNVSKSIRKNRTTKGVQFYRCTK